ncbi:MAG: thiamine pyrophosphate-binding protein [Deltaproteobacteria bacterium]|nr:thiamine pyrophosphate-binding protein [Deltaproteobacteria bacterium]
MDVEGEGVMKTQAVNFLVEYLANLGVTHIFGIPGGPLTPFYMAVYNGRKIEPILTKHELGAAFMADGYARVRGGIGVCCGTTGPGSTNLITGVASAYADSVPLLVLTGQVATKAFGKGASQESTEETVDIVEMFRKITRYSALVMRGDKLPEMLHRAMSHALGGRTGPVHLNVPCDTMFHEVEYGFAQLRTPIVRTRTFDRESIKQAVVALLRASRPGVLLGHGTVLSDACYEARLIAEMLSIPVATTPKAKGAFPEDHKLSLGVFGFSGHPAAEKYLLENGLDVLLAVGTSFNEWGSLSWDRRLQPRESLLHVDIDPAQIGRNYPSKVPLIGDANWRRWRP